MNIGVYTDMKTLNRKMKHSNNPERDVWWRLNNQPKETPTKLFVACNSRWQGYFTVDKMEKVKKVIVEGEIVIDHYFDYHIYLDEWHSLEEGLERIQFQGFTYDVPEIEDEVI